MDADDAVEFFETFKTEFAVGLEEMGRDWSYYFEPDGVHDLVECAQANV